MNSNSVRAVLEDLGKRAGVKKKLNPHAFRHARATVLAKHLKESELRAYMGWTPGSPMPGIYVHLSGRDTDAAILAAYGLSTPDSSRMLSRPSPCPTCGVSNPNGSRMCIRCGQPLDTETAKLADEAQRELGFALPAVAANPKAMRDFRRLLHKHKIEQKQETVGTTVPTSPAPGATGHGLSRTAI